MPIKAVCWRSGQIRFLPFVPKGAMEIASGTANKLRPIVESIARHAYDGHTLLVPGIPEADSDADALYALDRFAFEVEKRLGAH